MGDVFQAHQEGFLKYLQGLIYWCRWGLIFKSTNPISRSFIDITSLPQVGGFRIRVVFRSHHIFKPVRFKVEYFELLSNLSRICDDFVQGGKPPALNCSLPPLPASAGGSRWFRTPVQRGPLECDGRPGNGGSIAPPPAKQVFFWRTNQVEFLLLLWLLLFVQIKARSNWNIKSDPLVHEFSFLSRLSHFKQAYTAV